MTGANADKRIPLKPSEQKKALAALYGKLNNGKVSTDLSESVLAMVDMTAAEIRKMGSKAVVVSGIDDVDAQRVILAINEMLGSEAFDTKAPKYTRQGNTKDVQQLIADMKAGTVGMLIMDGVNPMYTLPNAADFAEGVEKVDLSVTFSTNWNETTERTQFTAAANHYLESWGDAELKKGHFSLMQPTIKELFDTKQFQQALLTWMGNDQSYYEYIKNTWTSSLLGDASWNKALHDGVFDGTAMSADITSSEVSNESEAGNNMVLMSAVQRLAMTTSEGMELILYPKVGMGDGQQANNPWLQEFPDPITRVTWDNYITVSKADASELGLINENVANGGLDGSYANLTVNGVSLGNVPVIIQPGQAPKTVGLSFGYGRKVGMKEEMQTGINAYAVYTNFNTVQSVSIEKAGGMHEFACIQLQNTLMGRGEIIKETTLEKYNTEDPHEWNPVPQVSLNHQEVPATTVDLWDVFRSFYRTSFQYVYRPECLYRMWGLCYCLPCRKQRSCCWENRSSQIQGYALVANRQILFFRRYF